MFFSFIKIIFEIINPPSKDIINNFSYVIFNKKAVLKAGGYREAGEQKLGQLILSSGRQAG